LPGLRSVSSTVILLGIIWTFNMFPVIYLIAGPNPNTRILVTYAFERFFSGASRDYAIASTYGVLILSVLLVFATVYRRALRSQGEVW
jgi:arabinogalactan oligomer/maltooligosaccharide transport system permease protein